MDSHNLIDPGVFASLQTKIDDDSKVRDQLREIVEKLEKHVRAVLSQLSNAHSARDDEDMQSILDLTMRNECFGPVWSKLHELADVAREHPYYKFNGLWSRQIQETCFAVLFLSWLNPKSPGQLWSIESVGEFLGVPVNSKDVDEFHITIEEYLHALISLIDELARLARNSVTQGNYDRPILISQFVKDLHAGFQLLNLKNDSLRKRSDGIKYKMREIEDVVYDLSLRNLVPRPEHS